MIKRKGKLFKIHPNATQQLPNYINDYDLSLPIINFITTLFELCGNDPEGLTDISHFQEKLRVSRATILNRVKSLEAKGFIVSEQVSRPNIRSTGMFVLMPVENKAPESRLPSVIQNILPDLSEYVGHDRPNLLPIDSATNPISKGEALMFFLIFSILPSKAKVTGIYEREVNVGSSGKVLIRVLPKAGGMTASIMDYRALSAVIGILINQEFNVYGTIPETFTIKVADLLKYMGYPDTSGSRRLNVIEQFSRWATTGFEVIKISKSVQSYYGNTIRTNRIFHILPDFGKVDIINKEGCTPEEIFISLNSEFRNRLMDPDHRYSLSLHENLMREKTPIAIQLHLWTRRNVTARLDGKSFELKHLWKEVDSELSFCDFRDKIKGLLSNRGMFGSEHSFRSLGYIYTLVESTEPLCRIEFDMNDSWAKKIKRTNRLSKEARAGQIPSNA